MLKLMRKILNRLGFDIVRASTLHRDLGDHLKRILEAKGIDGAIDVGANVGQYGRLLRDIGFTGHIYSFEPVTAVFEKLQAAAAGDSKWHCFRLALGEASARKTINVYDSHVFSSFLSANDYSKGIWKSLHGVHDEEVEVARLDDLFDGLPNRAECRNFLLKMDTQGFDLQVFRGALKSLASVQALQSELALIAIYDGTPDPYEVLAEFNAQGFSISGMYVINRDESLVVIEYDVTLVRRAAVL
jgi:FkbM family methyltransferase